ncbi:SDR family NAD(P)-dependent oxidoreductase [Clostridium formicaceticum]|uniref:Polyketide synthase PksN n=1 Tax=Clostridium formicaceticum TaxID=1497 RepID=A0AAC9RGU0_9CLOT|nr:SDR family NAD(P)-dependent oxidoreductase [Clostridium formicaceticum]AOY76260.1 hypothetical protein BJL90_10315 [Clostridium formicaceticum]ARE86644.1 Polyketide synthase PksN [Clostridium formicaceticum]
MLDQFLIDINHPILKNHKAYGQELLPGLAYIDMIYQLFRENGYDYKELELRNLCIYHPLIVGQDYNVMISIQCSEINDGQWQIRVEGQEQYNGTLAPEKKLYITAEMHRTVPIKFEETLNFWEVQRSAKRVLDFDEAYEQCRNRELIHTGFMKANGKIYESDVASFIDISLSQSALPSAEGFMFHPVLIDGSAITLLASALKEEQRLFLPLFYESFRASELFKKQCATQIKTSSIQRKKELINLTMEFFNESGKKIGELKNFANKLVRADGMINPNRKKTSQLMKESQSLKPSIIDDLNADKSKIFLEAESFLRQLMADRLKKSVDLIENQVGYYEMGLDSPGLLELVRSIEAKIQTTLPPTLLFEYTTIAELSVYLAENYASKFARCSEVKQRGEQESGNSTAPDYSTAAQTSIPELVDHIYQGNIPVVSDIVAMPAIDEDIAIIGMSGRFPEARDLQEFWINLENGKDCISEIPKSRWDWRQFEGLYSPSGKNMSKWGGFIDNPDCFDPEFFRISPREAEIMDPQERLFLETCWEAIEDAGYTPKTLVSPQGTNKRRHVGVFVGVMHKDYTIIGAEAVSYENAFPLSLSYAPIANRVSFFCNFHGPSMAIDTVCSSSLTAVHLALESIRRGECETALAGGVNLSLHPNKYLTYGMMDMHASDGYCHTFGKGGDGYVSGEAIGAVLLKPLQKAIQDRDHIYAVIKGSSTNHVGTVSGFTVPSPVAQSDMIVACLEKIGIHPRSISYIEAHGTGTSLGDPIEIQGLVKAYSQYTQDLQFCSIGSVKSNIGHAEAAAGISGLIKVVLQLYYKTLVPSLHSEELNAYIDFKKTPFYVQQQVEEWKQPLIVENGNKVSYPRRAGLSSFGATGSNVHIVLEEYPTKELNKQTSAILNTGAKPVIIPLSAINKERLQAYTVKLLEFLKEAEEIKISPYKRAISLSEIAYTLQVGREAMQERVAFLVKDIPELIEKLEAFQEGKETINNCWRGQVKHSKETIDFLSTDQDSLELINKWIEKGNVIKIAELWVKGFEINWELLYGDTKPNRISLPTYPFARERYWVPETKTKSGDSSITTSANVGTIHPLLHQNTSDLSEQRFSSTFTGQEFFLTDHVVKGQSILPGVAYLEMARAAVEQASGILEESQIGIRLRNVVWARPIAVEDKSVRVHIGLYPEEGGEIAYEIYSQAEKNSTEPIVYSQGIALLSSVVEGPTLDLSNIQAQCNQNILSSDQCYEAFKSIGIEYGDGHRGIEQIYVGSNQVLAKLTLPSCVADTLEEYVLHPSLMDSALQASIGLMMIKGDKNPLKLSLPFALQELEIFKNCTSEMWALIRLSDGSKAEDKVQKFDIAMCDEQGKICVRIKEFSTRGLEEKVDTMASIGTLMLHPYWKEQTVSKEAQTLDYKEHVVILCQSAEATQESIENHISGVRCLSLQFQEAGIEEGFQSYAIEIFEEIQSILKNKPAGKVLVQIVIPAQEEQQLLSGLSGLLKTAQLENPKILGQLIEIEADEDLEGIIEKLQENSRNPMNNHIRYQEDKRYVTDWKEIEVSQESENIPWKEGGIYLITGGAGGLGRIFAEEILQKVKDVTLILTGRSPLKEEKEARLKELETLGGKIEYKQVDVTQKKAVISLIQSIQEDFGSLDGIIHSAGVIRDNFIIKKTKDELEEVLAPKVTGLVNLDEASKDLSLDFFIFFSSAAGAFGNAGQADYATANAFMDAYAKYRNALVVSKQRQGQTLSINWPLWKEGGMQIDAETEKMMQQSTGIVAMQTTTGIRALYQGLASRKEQVIVIEGDLKRLHAIFMEQASAKENKKLPSNREENKAAPVIGQDLLQEKAINYFKKLLSSIIKLPIHRIEADASMEQYGIDSIMVMQLTNQLEKTLGSLPKTLFFEYQNIKDLTGYFVKNYRNQLLKLLEIQEKAVATTENTKDFTAVTEAEKLTFNSRRTSRFAYQFTESLKEKENVDIAIIGVSGRYPQAKNIQEFWYNLRNGKDCITEIPKDRWNHSLYFDEDKNKLGKTYSKWGGFIEGVDQFDPLFFNISPREAEMMDPQERLFLECVYETLEDAGYTRETLSLHQSFGLEGNVGVYVGVMYEEYQLYGAQEQIQGRPVALTGSQSSIANRVSYFCNFHGPSMAVDTMCSSSLTAIHLACQSLQRGGCELAIAGGVNVSIHPNKYLMLGQGKFVSSKGQCESFGEGGDGYVPGEGVGAVLLKPLSKAIADGDHIYGIIKGSTINHGGKTNGYTVPNPNAQAEVIQRAFKEAKVDPRTISYIEAHGTGTSLGDPIEIVGLSKAFQEYTKEKQFCAIGSAKSNIGHCESAAGIAAVTKVLLQLKHRKLVPSLHSDVLNPNIDFSNSPFVVQQELTEWKRPIIEKNGEKREYPRIAGISSFGAGGSNAHIVIEEYIPKDAKQYPITITPQNPAIIVLSAKNEERLQEQAQQLLKAIQEQQFTDNDLADMAYTLQIGREAMEERLAIIVASIKELEEKLDDFAKGQENIEDLYRGQVKRNKETLAVFAMDEEMQEAIEKWIQRRKYAKLLDLWVKGLVFDWNKLYNDTKPNRISLPTYPFARERYWVPETKTKSGDSSITTSANAGTIHPLLHQNTSDLSEQRFSSTFTGQEFFLTDHVVKGQSILPGVAYLEMARAAVEQASGILEESQIGIRLRNVVWARPIAVEDKSVRVHIGLYPEEGGEIAYEIYSQEEKNSTEPIVYSQGIALLSSVVEAPTLDLSNIQAQCNQNILSSDQCYEAFKSIGIEYGDGHRGIEQIHVGSNQVLAKLRLPSCVADTLEEYMLHPSLMDSALQASIGLMMIKGDKNPLKLSLPFALQELEIFKNCTREMWALVGFSDGSKAKDKVQKFDITMCDEQGEICVQMKGFSTRGLEGEVGSVESTATLGTLMLHPYWKEQTVSKEAQTLDYAEHVVILCQSAEATQESIENHINGVRCLSLQAQEAGIEAGFQSYAIEIFEEIQSILKSKPTGKVLVQIVISPQEEQQLLSGLSGLLKTAQLENPKILGQLIEIEADEDLEGIIEKLQENSKSSTNHVRYQKGKRYITDWNEIEVSQESENIPWKEGGIYLITGGAGGLGRIFAEEILQKVKDVTLILTGRSPLKEEKEARLKELERLGGRIEYKQVDVTQKKAVISLIQSIQEDFGSLDGIIHSAGVIRDNFIIKKTKDELEEVLAPKVTGLVNLDEASKDLSLDFFIFFSSAAGAFGNAGQADYATANAFMDAYAKYRNALVVSKQRQGQTLSINWPLWKEGGMQIDAETEKMMQQSTGIIPMQTTTGIWALYQGLASRQEQVMVMEGNYTRMKEKLFSMTTSVTIQSEKLTEVSQRIDKRNLLDKVQIALIKAVSKALKVKLEDIDIDTELSEYGFDSITLTEFANKLNEQYKLELTPIIFFEHPTIQSFSEYLIEEYQTQVAVKFVLQTEPEIPVTFVKGETKEAPYGKRRGSRFGQVMDLSAAKSNPTIHEPIAIVGMSGKFPMSKDINEFWKQLQDGKDCITEIPKDRWDWREYYGDPSKETNKTNAKWGGFIEGLGEFDPMFFGISPREAKLMDPQQRLLMIYIWKAIEDAGYSPQSLSGSKTGIFVGTAFSGYGGLISRSNIAIEGYSSTGMISSVGPNRMSYFLNIHGPSEPIETACSSSLVAIHRAVNAIENGTCEMAIVGGVNTIVAPELHISFSRAGMLCADGRCKTFSNQANGYVRGEGVGMIFLKKLKDAEEAGDHIYGVIRGSAENHGGRANSLTAPNPKAQAELLKTAYTKAGIDPRTVSYIEAHGTGTELGDPIEIDGLKKAFKELYQATGDPQVVAAHCGLGSVKTNIGHLELAAGIAGVIKVLLQIKHKTLVKSLHCDEINPYIQLDDSPFYIVRETKKWKPLLDTKSREIPRRAGVSSFGFGGAYAHVVIEEYIPQDHEEHSIIITPQNPAIIVLSAKNEERLHEQVQQLLTAIQEQQFSDSDLADMAYTLQVGREAMEERLGVMVGSIKELEEKLKSFVEGQEGIEDLYRGQLKRNKETLAIFVADEDMAKTIDAWISKGKHGKLLDLWVKGLNFDWNKLYGDTKPSRISLPTYPFARERYWVPETKTKSGDSSITTSASIGTIHPLLHQNTSNFTEQRFSSTFTGQEFFLTDHVVKGQSILPGVAYLEMARAAVKQASGTLEKYQTKTRLKNMVWSRPITVEEKSTKIHIGLYPEEGGEIAYEIYSQAEKNSTEPVIYSQGIALLSSMAESPTLDLSNIQAQCNQNILSSHQCYEAFESIGIEYGDGHRGIEQIYVGSNQVLAKLTLPSCVADTLEEYVLHPSLMDSALQASIGLMMVSEDKNPLKLSLPFALQELEIFKNCTSEMWALVRYSDGRTENDKVQKLDIDLCDDQGEVCVRMKGFSSRVLEGEVGSVESMTTLGTLMLHPCWKEQAIAETSNATDYAQHLVMFCEPCTVFQESIKIEMEGMRCLILQSEQESIEERFQAYTAKAFEEIQSILKHKPVGKILIQIVITVQEEQQLLSGLSGLLKTAQLENPKILGQLIEIEADEDLEGIIEKLQENSRNPINNHVRYQEGKRYITDWREIEVSKESVDIPWKEGGIYLITGGARGLGLIFAKEILQKVKDVTLILTGRSPLKEDKHAGLKELERLGGRIEYKQVDVTQKKAVISLIQSIQKDFGSLDGIIHSAGVIRDNFIIKKTKDELEEVLAPKVTGLVNLDEASKDLSLDFFILFSSIAGSLGNPGQADYAAANAFMDAYAKYRNALVASKQRQGQTLSINWPLWKEGGMYIDRETEKMLMRDRRMVAMETPSGIQALYQGLASGKSQVMVMEGNVIQLRNSIVIGLTPDETAKPKEGVSVFDDSLKIQTLNYVKKILANELKLSHEKLQLDTSFEKYGIDSIMQMELIRKLEKVTGELSKTLLFEHSNIQELVEYLLENHSDKLLESLTVEKDQTSKQEIPIYQNLSKFVPAGTNHRFLKSRGEDPIRTKQETEDIAIIGISGRYPMSDTLEELWKHLKAGDNCITEAPKKRWSNSLTQSLSKDELQHLYKRYYGGFIDGINQFDHQLFEIVQDQVWELSPEIRLFLEIVWETFEDAGYNRLALQELQSSYENGVGVFVGTMYNQYSWSMPSLEKAVLSSNGSDWQIANRTSHFFNLTGPSIAVNSACSSSLTAIHLACESLKQKNCSIAIAGGVNLTLDPSKYDALQREKFLGSGSQSKSFGTGDGYIPGEGVGAVLLKPLPQAIKDHDRIHAVIKSSFVNHSGNRQMYTVPDPKQQAKLIEESIRRSGINPVTISYVESAANGSELGDPIEVIALHNAFGQYTDKKQYCALGSVKSNLGHLEAASGISQLSKVFLQMKYQTLVPSINATPRNPNIKLERTAFYLQEETTPWRQFTDTQTGKSLPRRSMINSFGAGGSYANIIVEEFIGETPIKKLSNSYSEEFLVVFSAKTEWSLSKYLAKMQAFLHQNSSVNIDDVALSLQKINHNLEYRAAIIASSVAELLEKLDLLQKTRRTLLDSSIYISLDKESNLNSLDASMIQQVLEKKDLRQLAQYWVVGATIDFKQFYEESKGVWIDLPKYAFDHNIEFAFNKDNSIVNTGIIQDNNDFYLDLTEKISKGELSEEQFKKLIIM